MGGATLMGETRRPQSIGRRPMTTTTERLLSAGTVEEVRARGCTIVTGGGHAIAVFPLGDRFAAVDNRCPHMGFPLDRGTVSKGILTCHWHHARFDLSSGGTFDPFADDVRAFPVTVSDGRVWVDPSPSEADPVERWSRRLEDGMEHNIRLVIAKSILGLNSSLRRLPDAVDHRRQVRDHLLGSRLGTSPDDDDLLGQHPPSSLPRRPLARPLPGHQTGSRRVRRKTSPLPGRSAADGRDPPRGLRGMVPKLHRGP